MIINQETELELDFVNQMLIYVQTKNDNKNNRNLDIKQEKNNYESIRKEINDLLEFKKTFKDDWEQDAFEQEEKKIQKALNELSWKLKKNIIISYDVSIEGILIEIRPGTGGDEACIFCNDLFRMYFSFSKIMKWKLELIDSKIDKAGNPTFYSFSIKGEDSYIWLKNEAGVHRVQRIPETERKDRVHTSTVSVVVLPQIKESEVKINKNDLKIDTFRSSGAGGQHVNTTDSAVRVTHIPTGIVAFSQDGRSQHSNKENALTILRSRIFEQERKQREKIKGNIRSSVIAGSERSEKIRTYNWIQNRIKDHRLGISWNRLEFLLSGNIKELCLQLIELEVKKKIKII